jgi:outer membrane protein assembly factor BamB
VYGQPLVVGGTVLAATEGDSVYALDRATGAVRWRRRLGTPVPLSDLPCGDIDPLGITSTPVYDRATGVVYVVAETTGYHHVLVGLKVATGAVVTRREIASPDGEPRYDQQRSALLLSGGRVYISFGGLDGDCGPYVGSIVGVSLTGGPAVSYKVPTAREGGMWAPGGHAVGPGGDIYVSAGNSAADSGAFDGGDSVTALSAGLIRSAVFAPSTWGVDNANDLDLGSLTPVILPNGRVLIDGKRGTAYLLNAPALGGVGGQVAQAGVCRAFGAAAVVGGTVYLPCPGTGITEVTVTGDRVRLGWRGPSDANGSPVVGGGAVWVADWDDGTLYALAQGSGRVLARYSVANALPHFVSPTLSGGLVLVGTLDGVTALAGA